MNTKQPPRSADKTAHQLWVDRLRIELTAALYPPSIQEGKAVFMYSKAAIYDRYVDALQKATHFENTRIRCITYGMTDLLEASDRRAEEIKAEHDATPFFRFARLRRLKRQHQDQRIMQEAFKKAVLVVVNTTPPDIAVAPSDQVVNLND